MEGSHWNSCNKYCPLITVSTPAIKLSSAMTIATFLSIFSSFSKTLSSSVELGSFFSSSAMDLSMYEMIMLEKNRLTHTRMTGYLFTHSVIVFKHFIIFL